MMEIRWPRSGLVGSATTPLLCCAMALTSTKDVPMAEIRAQTLGLKVPIPCHMLL